MKFDIKALALTAGLIWGGAMLVVTSANLIWPGYGQSFLDVIASIYPGFRPGAGISSVIVGTIYGVVDAAIGGAIFGWLYNLFAKI
jgi:hypothetical protein